MHPIIAYGLAHSRMVDLDAEADRSRLAAKARLARKPSNSEPFVSGRWALRRLFARLHLAGSGA